jgi:hypothetical protein
MIINSAVFLLVGVLYTFVQESVSYCWEPGRNPGRIVFFGQHPPFLAAQFLRILVPSIGLATMVLKVKAQCFQLRTFCHDLRNPIVL